tara:strand:- start:449 stop:619 length:171 start_codon:yes stop_codon:yes gene_type:complete
METFFLLGVLGSSTINHILWNSFPSEEQLEREKYWETQVKIWKSQKEQEEKLKNVA